MSDIKTVGQKLSVLPAGRFATLCKIMPTGSLQARRQAGGAVSFFWRYSIGTNSERVPIGLYDSSAAPKSLVPGLKGFSYAAAVRAAETMAVEHHQHRDAGGRPALLRDKKAAKHAEEEAMRQLAEHTLTALLTDYCDYQESIGRSSHADARSIFRLHVERADPYIASLPAKDVTEEQIADLMRKLVTAGKRRTANKLRSYARSAFQIAKSAKSKASIPAHFKAYGVKSNPVAETSADETANRADKKPLTLAEMQLYWSIIQNETGLRGAVLRLHLLTGAQRIAQLARLRTVDASSARIRLFDGKGRPGHPPREHVVPLIPAAARALEECGLKGQYALSTDGGTTHIAPTTLSDWAIKIVGQSIKDFQPKRLRSGVETLLASARTSQEIRGRMQSHGVSGVQARHYDAHDYMAEKEEALETLFSVLTGGASPFGKAGSV